MHVWTAKAPGALAAVGIRPEGRSYTWLRPSRSVIPDEILVLNEEDLVVQFRGVDQRRLGGQWIDRRASAVLAVRSTIVPFEHNYLLNPQHPDFAAIAAEPALPFAFDERLFGPRQFR